MSVGVVVADRDGSASFANRAWTALTGQGGSDWPGHGWLDALDDPDGPSRRADLLASVGSGSTYREDWEVTLPTSRRVLQVTAVPEVVGGRAAGLVATAVDVTDDRAERERLSHRATHDPLTGLYNRAQFLEFVGHALERQRREPRRLAAVLFIDVDGLKQTNDRLGHGAGDRLLQIAALRISGAVRPADVVARYGGDEFAVLCEDLQEPDEAASIAARIGAVARGTTAGHERVSLSVGVALTEDPHVAPAAVVDRADRAMYTAKHGVDDPPESAPATRTRVLRPASPPRDPESVLAAAAHELLGPVTAIKGYAELLHEDRHRMSPDDVEDAITVLERQSSSLAGLLEELLELGRRHNRTLSATEPVLVADAISDALESAPPPEDKTVTVRSTVPELSVRADRRGLARVVANLLTNAYRYGGPHITIGSDSRSGRVVLSVDDDGEGVPDEIVPTLFMPFTRGQAPDEPGDPGGAGLGLALAREIVESTGGHLEYRPARPSGARLIITLPEVHGPTARQGEPA